ncbi:MAG: pilus assembly protein PilM [Candidatus Omnitrophica bacterium]|nr:pilus assembly protein PilM [Candidatus Omnitrophota bacterium]
MNLQVCLDICEKYIRFIEGYEKRGNLYIINIEKVDNPIENFKEIGNVDVEVVGNFLKDFFKKNKFKAKIGLFTINNSDTIYHYFEVPNLPEEEIKNVIKLEGIQIIPQFIENYEYDYISFNVENKKNITLIAYPKNKVDLYTQILLKARLKPVIMDIHGTALLNSFLYFNKEENPVCLLNFGFSISNFVIYSKDKFLFLRDIEWGIKNIKEEEIYNESIIEEKMSEFNEEIKISIRYFQNKIGEAVNKIYLTGEIFGIPDIKKIIEKNINISTEYYNPLLLISNNLIPLDKKEDGMSYAICIGLLMRKII